MSSKQFAIKAVIDAVDRFSEPMRRMRQGVGGFARQAKRDFASVGSAIDGMAGAAAKVGLAAAPLGLAAKSVIASGAEFEQAIADLGAVSLTSRDQIRDLEAEAKRLGATTKFTATEAANAMEVMARAGFTNEQVLKGIGGVLAATAAEGGDIVAVTETVSSIIKGMGIDAAETTRVADVLALASSKTKSTITSLGESMKTLGPVARQVGVSMEEAVAMAALLQDVGLDASEAGTATATMFTKLSKPGAQVAATLKKMGVAFKDAKGNMLPPVQVLQQLQKAAKQAGGNMDQLALFADLVGLRGQKAALNLSKLFESGKGEELVEMLNNAAGSAEKMAGLRMDTLEGDLNILKAAVDSVKIALFDTQSGALRGLIQGFTEWVETGGQLLAQDIAGFLSTIAQNMETIVKWGKRIGVVIGVLYGFSLAVKAVAFATSVMNTAMTVARVSVLGFKGVMFAAKVAMVAFNAIAALNPFVLIGMAVAGAVVLVATFWDEISEFFDELWGGAKEVAGAIGSWFAGAFETVKQFLAPLTDFLVGYFEFAVGLLVMIWSPVIDAVKGIFGVAAELGGVLIGVVKKVFDAYVTFWSGIFSTIAQGWARVVQLVMPVIDTITQAVSSAWSGIVEAAVVVVETLKAVWAPIEAFFVGLWQGIVSTFQAIVGPILDGVGWVVDRVNDVRGVGRQAMGSESPQVVSPQERTARSIEERTSRVSGEVTVRAPGMKTEVSRQAPGGSGLVIAASGGF